MKIEQNNKAGKNEINFNVVGDFMDASKTFKNSQEVSNYFSSVRREKRTAYIIALIASLITIITGLKDLIF